MTADRGGSSGSGSEGEEPFTPSEPDPADQYVADGDGKPSGLRNPGAAVRGVGAGTLVIEGIVLLLAIQPIRIMGGALPGLGIWAMVGLSVACFLLCGLLKHRWAWHVGTALQILVIGCGVFQWGIAAIGVIFLGLWLYVLNVRKSVLG